MEEYWERRVDHSLLSSASLNNKYVQLLRPKL